MKEEVDEQVSKCSSASKACEDRVLGREIEREEIAVCVRKLKNNKTGGSDGFSVGASQVWWVRYDRLASAVVWSSLARVVCSTTVEERPDS